MNTTVIGQRECLMQGMLRIEHTTVPTSSRCRFVAKCSELSAGEQCKMLTLKSSLHVMHYAQVEMPRKVQDALSFVTYTLSRNKLRSTSRQHDHAFSLPKWQLGTGSHHVFPSKRSRLRSHGRTFLRRQAHTFSWLATHVISTRGHLHDLVSVARLGVGVSGGQS